ncbi:hypothetical protein JFV29_09370 [Peribacillus sp. TH16]|uniref:hypothetical protein n=1 Tax=Peribacillus sp. TH16 TaxID=2798482 RepID=UPI0019127CB8|nr:hypothetical protein [Peribacillus sp. TH16]MBK5482132.1 hypothetical protein [Peribacillus sp. TH16]
MTSVMDEVADKNKLKYGMKRNNRYKFIGCFSFFYLFTDVITFIVVNKIQLYELRSGCMVIKMGTTKKYL